VFAVRVLLPIGDAMGSGDCEAIQAGILAQPINAISSAAYLIAAIVIVFQARRLSAGQIQSWLFAGVLTLVGVGSVDFHGPQSPWAQFAHDAPIVVLVAWIAILVLLRWRQGTRVLPGFNRARVAGLIVVMSLALLAFFAGRTDSVGCDPDSVLQPHAAWHVLTAIGFLLIWQLMYYGSERSRDDQRNAQLTRPGLPADTERLLTAATARGARLVVVSAVLLRDSSDRVLIATRPIGKSMSGSWEFPGGKVEPNETPLQALRRELVEELGVHIDVDRARYATTLVHDYPEFTLIMPTYECRHWTGEAVGREGQELAWVEPNDLGEYQILPADGPLVTWLQD
jgi:8-oxo-dGTP diphosphatase